ncbi:MAG: hypothetical protein KME17_04930 [Cyanosarcina radialis HA8281-LM2]|jgi:hypothetical protein|nr:hypothetical protein [Cyanosarcina radialis HA8281-LM2]
MSNRLKFFREQMAAFEGAVDPQRAISGGYYIPEPRKSVSELISRRIGIRPSSTHLILGGIGSGKTTQLLVTRDRINQEVDNVYAHYVDVSLYTNISEISPGVLTAVAGVVLCDLVVARGYDLSKVALVKNRIELVKNLAYGYSERKLVDRIEEVWAITNPLETTSVVIERHEGILNPKYSKEKKELIASVAVLYNVARSQYGEIVLLLDGLDRLNNIQAFSQIIATDIQDLLSLGVGIVLVGPLRALYGEYRDTIEQAVNYFDYRSCFDVKNDSDSYTFFEKIIETRASEGFIEKAAIQSLIHYSGGVLRDLINLTQAAIEEAYLADSDTVQKTDVEASADSFGKAKLLGLSDEELEIFADMLEGNTFLPRTDEKIRLLVAGHILEYRYPKKRYAIHPALLPALQLVQQN